MITAVLPKLKSILYLLHFTLSCCSDGERLALPLPLPLLPQRRAVWTSCDRLLTRPSNRLVTLLPSEGFNARHWTSSSGRADIRLIHFTVIGRGERKLLLHRGAGHETKMSHRQLEIHSAQLIGNLKS